MILYLLSIPCSFPNLPPLEGLSSLNEVDELNLSTYVFLQYLGNILNQESVWLFLQGQVLLVGMLFFLQQHDWQRTLILLAEVITSSMSSLSLLFPFLNIFHMFALFWFRSDTKTTPQHLADLTCHRHL